MKPEGLKQFYTAEKIPPDEMSDKAIFRELVKKIHPDLMGAEYHALALELAAAKEEADKGDSSALRSLYKKLNGEKGELVDIRV